MTMLMKELKWGNSAVFQGDSAEKERSNLRPTLSVTGSWTIADRTDDNY